jgi:hypothetical protein
LTSNALPGPKNVVVMEVPVGLLDVSNYSVDQHKHVYF